MCFGNYEIRYLKESDAASYFQLIQDNKQQLENYVAGIVSKTKTLADTEAYVDSLVRSAAAETHFPYVVADIRSQELMGYIEVKNIDWNIAKGEIGYFVDKDLTGKGIGTQMLQLIAYHYLEELGFLKLLLRIHEDNHSSRKIAGKNGFKVEGMIRNDYRTGSGHVVHMLYYGKTRD